MRIVCVLLLAFGLAFGTSPAAAQLYSPAESGPLSAFEYHEGSITTLRATTRPAQVKLRVKKEKGKPATATLAAKQAETLLPTDSITGFAYDNRRFLRLSTLKGGAEAEKSIHSEFVEVFQDTGRIELYGFYAPHENRFVVSSFVPGVVHETDLVRSFIYRRRGDLSFQTLPKLPPRGYSPAFEAQWRMLLADRQDLLELIEKHYLRRNDLPAVVQAYNTGQKVRFE
jgi:hypothetical protein